MTRPLNPESYREVVRLALAEDVGTGDVTTSATVGAEQRARGTFRAKSACVLAGQDIAIETFRQLEPRVQAEFTRADGDRIVRRPCGSG